MHHRLGEPLPHQLPNAPQVHPSVYLNFKYKEMPLYILSGISYRFQ